MVTFHTFVFKTEREFDEGGEVDAHVVVEQYTLLVGYSIDIQLFDAAQYGRCAEFGVCRCVLSKSKCNKSFVFS